MVTHAGVMPLSQLQKSEIEAAGRFATAIADAVPDGTTFSFTYDFMISRPDGFGMDIPSTGTGRYISRKGTRRRSGQLKLGRFGGQIFSADRATNLVLASGRTTDRQKPWWSLLAGRADEITEQALRTASALGDEAAAVAINDAFAKFTTHRTQPVLAIEREAQPPTRPSDSAGPIF